MRHSLVVSNLCLETKVSQLLAVCRGELSEVIAQLMSKGCVYEEAGSGREEIASPFPAVLWIINVYGGKHR